VLKEVQDGLIIGNEANGEEHKAYGETGQMMSVPRKDLAV
jgi:hypothetical protein